jgi:hypothetical protein
MTEDILNTEEQEVILESVEDYYNYLQTSVSALESDVLKASKGNKAASVRVRKALRVIKKHSGDFVKFTLGK